MNEPSSNKTGLFLILALGLVSLLFIWLIAQSLLSPIPGADPPETGRTSAAGNDGPVRNPSSGGPDGNPPRYASARPDLRNGGRISDPDLLTVQLNNEGLAHYSREEYSDAVDLFSRAFERAPENRAIRRNLALATGNWAWKQLDGRKYSDALLNFQKAVRLEPDEPDFYVGEGLAYYRTNDLDRSVDTLKTAIRLDPKRPDPYKIIGDIYYQRDEIEMAIGYYDKGLELDPADQALRLHLDQARREEKVQGGFQQQASTAFTVKFEGREEQAVARQVLHTLDEAYREVGQALFYYPQEPITVILYSDQQFRDVTRSATWSTGIFDGKIRVPIGGPDPNPSLLQKVLFHEYTHAVVHGLSRGFDVPTWLNEGIAVYFESGGESNRDEILVRQVRSGNTLIPLSLLHNSFQQLSGAQASLAYAESFAAVKALVDRYGMYQIRQLLEDLGNRKNFEEAFSDRFLISYETFQADWSQTIEGGHS